MLGDTEGICLGSLSLPEGESSPGEWPWTGRCPHCGAELELGYAGLVPVHEPADDTAGR